VALDGGRGTGSGRSIPGFDLLAGLDACAAHLTRHGGHRAAAGLELDTDGLDDFRAAFVAHAETVLDAADLVPEERVDAVVSGGAGAEPADPPRPLAPRRARGAVRDRRDRGVAGTVAAMVASGEPVLVVAADARIRRRQLAGLLGGFALCSWRALERAPSL